MLVTLDSFQLHFLRINRKKKRGPSSMQKKIFSAVIIKTIITLILILKKNILSTICKTNLLTSNVRQNPIGHHTQVVCIGREIRRKHQTAFLQRMQRLRQIRTRCSQLPDVGAGQAGHLNLH